MSCAYSMIVDHKAWEWKQRLDGLQPPFPAVSVPTVTVPSAPLITQQEIDEFRRLLERAREYDRQNGRTNCELDEKKDALRTLAKELGVEITFP